MARYGCIAALALLVCTARPARLRAADGEAPEHKALIGKEAPNIAGDACVNGDVKQLADLKGKVVLVDFWAVWCGPCIATFPHLREWDKKYGKEGLVILGATTYFRDSDFDAKAGELKKADPPLTAEQERAMVKGFAKHHNLAHPLLMLTQADIKKAAKDYAIQGIPMAVLIDRQGVIRMIRVGSDRENAHDLEGEMKKLLAQK